MVPSDTETFGNVVIVEMASGLPVVGVAAGGVLDTVVPQRNGLLAMPGDAVDMADRIMRLVEDVAHRHRLGTGARRSALERSWDSVFRDLFDAYTELAADTVARVA